MFIVGILIIPTITSYRSSNNHQDGNFLSLKKILQDDEFESSGIGDSTIIPSNIQKFSNSPWSMLCGDNNHTGLSKYDTSDNPGKMKKSYSSDGNIFSPQPLIGPDGIIYLKGLGKFLAMFPNGTEKWSIPYTTDFIPVLGQNGMLYLTTRKNLISIYSSNGTIEWIKDVDGFSSVILDDNNIIYFTTKKIPGKFNLNAYYPNGTKKWNISLDGESSTISFSLFYPAIDENYNLYMTVGDIVYSIYPNGTIRWKSELNIYYYLTSPTLDANETVYIQDTNDLIALYQNNGSLKWNMTISSNNPDKTIPAIGPDGNIYCGSRRVYAFTKDGDILWEFNPGNTVSTPTIGAEGTIYFSSIETFYALNSNGTLKWKRLLDSGIQSSSGIINSKGEIYVSGRDFYILGKIEPTPPTNFKISSGDSFINLSWFYPEDDGGGSVIEYHIYRGTSSAEKGLFITLGPNTHYFIDTSVENGVVYYYSITANNSEGESDFSPELSARPLAVPSPPRNLSINATENYIQISWEPPEDDGGTRVIAYDLYKGPTIDQIEYFKRIDVIKNSYQDSDLKVGQTYHYYLTASNFVGESSPSDIVFDIYRTVPNSPQNLTFISGDKFIHLFWLVPISDGGSQILKYKVHRGSIVNQDEVIEELEPDILDYNDTSVSNGITYTYNITTVAEVGESPPSNQISSTPMTYPEPPMNFSLEPGDGYVNLSWLDPLDNGGSPIQFFYIYRSGGDVEDIRINIPVGGGLTYQDQAVVNGRSYNYSISAVNIVGESDKAGLFQVIPVGISTPPTEVTVLYGSHFVHLFWEPPLSDAGSPIIGYRIYRDSDRFSYEDSITFDFNDTSVVNENTYSYCVTAMNGIGESDKSIIVWGYPYEIPVQTNPPTPPRDLAMEKGEKTVTLHWVAPENDGGIEITGYKMYRSLQKDGQFEVVNTVSKDFLSWTDMDMVLDREYFYYVIAFNDIYESNPSNNVSCILETNDNDDEGDDKGVDWVLIILPAILVFLLLVGLVFIVIYRRGKKDDIEDEIISQDTLYEQSGYDFDTIQQKSLMTDLSYDESEWE